MIIQSTISGFRAFDRLFSVLSGLGHIIVVSKIRTSINSVATNEECVPLASLIALTDNT